MADEGLMLQRTLCTTVVLRTHTLGSTGGGLDADWVPAVGVRPGCHCMATPTDMVGLQCTDTFSRYRGWSGG